MKHIKFLTVFSTLLIFSVFSYSQEVNTQGRDFWVSFMPNWTDPNPKLEILVSGQKACSGTATNPLSGWRTTFTVTPGVVTTVVIPVSEGLVLEANKVDRKAIHVTTTEDVSLYASNYVDHTYDVANVLPTAILMGNYTAVSYDAGGTAGEMPLHAKLLIVAVEDNTEITIDPKGGLTGQFPSYKKREVVLNTGECYLCFSARGDISGTTVNVKNGKKVVVFSGCDTQIPYQGCCYDAVFEQCMPMAYWGRHFVVTASAMRTVDIVRITSLAPGCRISIDGRKRKTLGAGKSFDYKLEGDKKEAVYISASSPVSVCVFLTSATWGGAMGDPSMVNINPIEQQMDEVTFASYNTAVSKYHFVNVVTQTDKVSTMTLDGISIASEFHRVPKKEEMSYARIALNHGAHTLKSDGGGFVAHIYGLGKEESYAYTVGSSTRVFNQFDEDGNLVLSTLPDEPEDLDSIPEEPGKDNDTPTYSHTDTLPEVVFGGIKVGELKRGGEARGVVDNPDGLPEDLDDYDVTADSDFDYLFEDIDVDIINDTIIISFHPRSQWCECFIPKRIKVFVILTPKTNENPEASRIVIPTEIPVEKESTWLSRCLWVLITIGLLFLFILYLISLLRKKRFKKDAMVIPSYIDYFGNKVDLTGTRLRKDGVLAWLARWFLPGCESRALSFDSPGASLRFFASDSGDVVNIPKNDIDPSTMQINGYKPDNDTEPQKPIALSSNGNILIHTPEGDDRGTLTFYSGDQTDGGGYRMFIGLLIMLSVLAVGALLVMMIRGLL